MKKWNEAEIVELNISETADWIEDLNNAIRWAIEEDHNKDYTKDGYIGDPAKGVKVGGGDSLS